jgi:hypothetical protein
MLIVRSLVFFPKKRLFSFTFAACFVSSCAQGLSLTCCQHGHVTILPFSLHIPYRVSAIPTTRVPAHRRFVIEPID